MSINGVDTKTVPELISPEISKEEEISETELSETESSETESSETELSETELSETESSDTESEEFPSDSSLTFDNIKSQYGETLPALRFVTENPLKDHLKEILIIAKGCKKRHEVTTLEDLLDYIIKTIPENPTEGFLKRDIFYYQYFTAMFFIKINQFEQADDIREELLKKGCFYHAVDIQMHLVEKKYPVDREIPLQKVNEELLEAKYFLESASLEEKDIEIIKIIKALCKYKLFAKASLLADEIKHNHHKAKALFIIAKGKLKNGQEDENMFQNSFNYARRASQGVLLKRKIKSYCSKKLIHIRSS